MTIQELQAVSEAVAAKAQAKLVAARDLRAELMPNGLIYLFDYRSGLSGLYERNGNYRSGDLRQPAGLVRMLAAEVTR